MLQYDAVKLDDCLNLMDKPVAILARYLRRLNSRAINIVKVYLRHHNIDDAT